MPAEIYYGIALIDVRSKLHARRDRSQSSVSRVWHSCQMNDLLNLQVFTPVMQHTAAYNCPLVPALLA